VTVGAFSKGERQHAALETRFLPRLGCPMRAVARADSEPGRPLEEEVWTDRSRCDRRPVSIRLADPLILSRSEEIE
jgi:hypothetical protein